MKSYIRSQTTILIITICLSAILSFWALQKHSCFEIKLGKEISIKAGFCD